MIDKIDLKFQIMKLHTNLSQEVISLKEYFRKKILIYFEKFY